jgi:hypothetical protein
MAQQTTVEKLEDEINILFDKSNHLSNIYTVKSQLQVLFEQAKEMEKRQIGLFLNWVIKHYSTETIDYMFAWVDSMGKEVNIQQILEHYYNETYGNNTKND